MTVNASIVLEVDFDVGANGKMESIAWDLILQPTRRQKWGASPTPASCLCLERNGVGATANITISGDSVSDQHRQRWTRV